jgi:2-aminoadipate transaminase
MPMFDHAALFRANLPPAAVRFTGFPRYNFIGGHNDAASVPVDELISASTEVLHREGRTLATYGLESGPLGYKPLRDFVAGALKARAGIACGADDILITSGSLQALDLVNALFLAPGDTVVLEAATYGGTITRLQRLGVNYVGVELDQNGMRMDHLVRVLDGLKAKGVRPKFIYTVPTVQNPTGTVMPEARRLELLQLADAYGTAIFEDDCYADLLWDGARPQAIRALDTRGRVIYCGSFSKSIAPALRVGYLVADWPVMSRLLPLKTDAGSGALEQMVVAEYAARHFDGHVEALKGVLKQKCETMLAALAEQFGAAAEFAAPKGGIFIWITLPKEVDTTRLGQVALGEGVALNPGAEWSADSAAGRNCMRLCFANASHENIREGVAKLAEICHREFGVPVRSANVTR